MADKQLCFYADIGQEESVAVSNERQGNFAKRSLGDHQLSVAMCQKETYDY